MIFWANGSVGEPALAPRDSSLKERARHEGRGGRTRDVNRLTVLLKSHQEELECAMYCIEEQFRTSLGNVWCVHNGQIQLLTERPHMH